MHERGLGELQRVADMRAAGEKFGGAVILGETKGSCWSKIYTSASKISFWGCGWASLGVALRCVRHCPLLLWSQKLSPKPTPSRKIKRLHIGSHYNLTNYSLLAMGVKVNR